MAAPTNLLFRFAYESREPKSASSTSPTRKRGPNRSTAPNPRSRIGLVLNGHLLRIRADKPVRFHCK